MAGTSPAMTPWVAGTLREASVALPGHDAVAESAGKEYRR